MSKEKYKLYDSLFPISLNFRKLKKAISVYYAQIHQSLPFQPNFFFFCYFIDQDVLWTSCTICSTCSFFLYYLFTEGMGRNHTT